MHTLVTSEDWFSVHSKIGDIVTHNNQAPQTPFAGATCSEKGDVTIWREGDSLPDRTRRANRHHFAISGLENKRVDFGGQTLYRMNEWYDWGFHPRGVWLCFAHKLIIIVLSPSAS